jgi:hypothetical protein
MQQGHKRLKITAWPCRKFFLVHEEVQHGVAVKTRIQGIGFKEQETFLQPLKFKFNYGT